MYGGRVEEAGVILAETHRLASEYSLQVQKVGSSEEPPSQGSGPSQGPLQLISSVDTWSLSRIFTVM